jgi:hypothetical protein
VRNLRLCPKDLTQAESVLRGQVLRINKILLLLLLLLLIIIIITIE